MIKTLIIPIIKESGGPLYQDQEPASNPIKWQWCNIKVSLRSCQDVVDNNIKLNIYLSNCWIFTTILLPV